MNQINFSLVLHNHQPVGNFPWVFEDAYAKCYLPMVHALEKHPLIKASLHYSGPLIDWLTDNRPDFIPMVASLVKRGQVEIIGSGYYEPILTSIPDVDKIGQINKMRDYIKDTFGTDAKGMWLTERVWEPHLPKWLALAGVEWTVADDSHFKMVGLSDSDLSGYYTTEEEGYTVKLFSSSKQVRYLIPFKSVEETIEYFKSQANESGSALLVLGDDGEKLGVWPGTYEHCWTNGWVERFFKALEENQGSIKVITLGEYLDKYPSLGRVYIPTASYEEMMEWALPTQSSFDLNNIRHELEGRNDQRMLSFIKGGFWRSFMTKYPEANQMHKKMLRVSQKVHDMADDNNKKLALNDLWKGQSNCPYWHGVFGGLYLTHVRSANYRNLIAAEKKVDAEKHIGEWMQTSLFDIDRDGKEEVILESDKFNLYIDIASGGGLTEWDIKDKNHNLQSVVARRPEVYHLQLKQSSENQDQHQIQAGEIATIHNAPKFKGDLISEITYDRYPRLSMLEHFISNDVKFEEFASGDYRDDSDFASGIFNHRFSREADITKVALERTGTVKMASTSGILELGKTVIARPGKESFTVIYGIKNVGDTKISTRFVSEWNLNLLGGGHNPVAYYEADGQRLSPSFLDESGHFQGEEVTLVNEYLDIHAKLTSSDECEIWRFPVESASNSERGIEKVYQGSCIALVMPLEIAPGEQFGLTLTWTF
ncbi:MAG: DUF1926 domain-containing protein [Dehalococcoidia bacterium]|nr:DUF1926 domain-containing protein [Dehalococcoidia bacterium]